MKFVTDRQSIVDNKPVGDRISMPSPKFCCHGNKGRPHNILHGSINWPSPKTPWQAQISLVYLPYKPSYRQFCENFEE